MNHSEFYMNRCLELAATGTGNVAPNPLVGCVIVKDERIISEGCHQKYGEAHAEVNAINKLPDDFDFSDCTLYVNLEPCSHHGKTPPCSDLIIRKNFKKVVIGNVDSNPLVGGKGIDKLRKARIEVESGILEKEGRELNKRFFTLHEKKRPYIILKWAQTANGLISRWPLSDIKEDNWISCNESKTLVHKWRSEEQSIMIGTNTAENDNPELTVRFYQGKNPIRIVIDKQLRLSQDLNIFNDVAPTIVITEVTSANKNNIQYCTLPKNEFDAIHIFKLLGSLNISSVLVEGGAKLLNSLIESDLWDEMRVFVNNDLQFKNGIKAPAVKLPDEYVKSGTDQLYILKNRN